MSSAIRKRHHRAHREPFYDLGGGIRGFRPADANKIAPLEFRRILLPSLVERLRAGFVAGFP